MTSLLCQNINVTWDLMPLASKNDWASAATGSALFIPSERPDSVVPLIRVQTRSDTTTAPEPLKNTFFNYLEAEVNE